MNPNNIYCIKCRLHTDNVDQREEQITSKGKLRLVVKAICAVCSKKKNRFIKNEVNKEQVVVQNKDDIQKEIDQLVEKLTELKKTANENKTSTQFDEKDPK